MKLGVLLVGSGAAGSRLLLATASAGSRTHDLGHRHAVALLTSQVLAHGMTSPLREMTAAARAMARGDYTRRVRATCRDEVGELAQAFNQMADDLAAADRQRRELIANVSHELRTPITALQGVLENIVDGVAEPDPATLRTALHQTERLGRLVAELLDLSRLDAGVQPLRPRSRSTSPSSWTRRPARPRSPRAARAGISCGTAAGRAGDRRTPTRSGCTRCSPTCSTTRPGTARRAARCG